MCVESKREQCHVSGQESGMWTEGAHQIHVPFGPCANRVARRSARLQERSERTIAHNKRESGSRRGRISSPSRPRPVRRGCSILMSGPLDARDWSTYDVCAPTHYANVHGTWQRDDPSHVRNFIVEHDESAELQTLTLVFRNTRIRIDTDDQGIRHPKYHQGSDVSHDHDMLASHEGDVVFIGPSGIQPIFDVVDDCILRAPCSVQCRQDKQDGSISEVEQGLAPFHLGPQERIRM